MHDLIYSYRTVQSSVTIRPAATLGLRQSLALIPIRLDKNNNKNDVIHKRNI